VHIEITRDTHSSRALLESRRENHLLHVVQYFLIILQEPTFK